MDDGSWPVHCPSCGAARVAFILYGLPEMFDEELNRGLDTGRIVLGGCSIWDGMPEWHCVGCGLRWGNIRLPPIPEAEA